MSGAEAIAILGIISSVISIVDGTKQVYDAASNTNGLPEAFREVAARLPIVRDILDSAKRHIIAGDTNEESCKAAMNVVESCQSKAQNLEEIFKKVIPADDASRSESVATSGLLSGKPRQATALISIFSTVLAHSTPFFCFILPRSLILYSYLILIDSRSLGNIISTILSIL